MEHLDNNFNTIDDSYYIEAEPMELLKIKIKFLNYQK